MRRALLAPVVADIDVAKKLEMRCCIALVGQYSLCFGFVRFVQALEAHISVAEDYPVATAPVEKTAQAEQVSMALHCQEASAQHVRASIRCCSDEDSKVSLGQVLGAFCLRV